MVQMIEDDALLGLLREQEGLLRRRADASRQAFQRGDATLAIEAPDVTALQSARAAVFDQERLQLGRRHQLNALLAKAGAIRPRYDIGRGTDMAAFDAACARAFSANSDGWLSVF